MTKFTQNFRNELDALINAREFTSKEQALAHNELVKAGRCDERAIILNLIDNAIDEQLMLGIGSGTTPIMHRCFAEMYENLKKKIEELK